MKPILMAGMLIVNLALLFYSIGIISEQRNKIISKKVLLFITLGVIFDIIATSLMIAGSSKGPFTLHGFLGYSSLLGMLTDAFLIWRLKSQNGIGASVPKSIHLFSRYAYIWWVLAYITGGLLVMFRYV